MKSLLRGAVIFIALLLGTIGCTAKERYVRVVEKIQPQAAMVEVQTIATITQMTISARGIEINSSTVPVKYAGSAVFLTTDGTLLTCAHLFDTPYPSTVTVITSDGHKHRAHVLNAEFDRDLALVRVTGKFEAATLTTKKLRLGQEVLAVGNPDGLEFSTSHGIISHLDRETEAGFFYTQIDAPINPGNSGGPLFNLDGELIGINAAKMQGADGLGFAISPETIADYLAQFRGL